MQIIQINQFLCQILTMWLEILFFSSLQKLKDSPKSLGAGDQLIRNANLQYRLANAKEAAFQQLEVSFTQFF